MALDVNSSLASTLFTPDRAGISRSKTADQIGTTSSRPVTQPGPKETSDSFSSYMGDKSSNATGKTASKPATQPPRKLMPGQIVDHQDTKVGNAGVGETSTQTGAAKEKAGVGETPRGEGASETVSAEGKDRVAEETTRESAQGHAEGASAESSVAAQAADNAGADGQGGSASQGQDGSEKREAETDAAQQDGASVEAVAVPVTQPVVVVATVGAPLSGGEAGAATAEASTPGIGSATDGKAAVTAPTLPPASEEAAAQGIAPTNDQGAAKVGVGEGVGKDVAKPATQPPAQTARPDTTLQPGMGEQVEARKEANATSAATKTGETSGIEASDTKASAKAAAEALRPAHEGPVLRGAIFSQVLEGFAGTHGLVRANDVLASLDANVAAQAQNNRAASDTARPTPLQMLPIEIGMQAVRGAREFQIRLDPAELGRVDVKLHINDKGEVNASMIVERPETLQMLRRDATTLAQAFEQAGLKQGENALSFSLRGDGQQGQQQQQGGSGRGNEPDDPTLNAQVAEIVSRRVMIPNSSLDLMV